MNITASLDRLHARVVRNILLQRFADFTRAILAVGFFAPGLHKLLGIPFTTLPLDNPIGAFFHALFLTGFHYRFIGAAQVVAAVLVLFRRTSTLGALLFPSITMNVFIVTVSIDFGTGTPIVTGLMLLASLYLVCWDYDKLKPLVPFLDSDAVAPRIGPANVERPGGVISRLGYWMFVVAGVLVTCEMRGLTPYNFLEPYNLEFRRGGLLVTLLGGIVMACGFVIDVMKRSRVPLTKREASYR